VSTSSRDDLTAAWNEVVGGFGDHDPPSTLLGVGALGYPGQLVEIEAIAFAAQLPSPTRLLTQVDTLAPASAETIAPSLNPGCTSDKNM
jgi:hypothetical protein